MTASPYTESAARIAAVAGVRRGAEVCGRCGASNLHPRSRMHFSDRMMASLFSMFPYLCRTCNGRERRFRFTWRVFAIPLSVLVAGGCIYAAMTLASEFRRDKAAAQDPSEMLARTRSDAGGKLSAYEQLMIRKPKQTIDNATVLKLWDARIGVNVILQVIRGSNSDFDITADSLIELKRAGVDESIILAMVDAYSER